MLVEAGSDAGYGKFEVCEGDVEPEVNKKSDEMYSKLKQLEVKLIGRVRVIGVRFQLNPNTWIRSLMAQNNDA